MAGIIRAGAVVKFVCYYLLQTRVSRNGADHQNRIHQDDEGGMILASELSHKCLKQ